jgi:putative redox protein
MSVMQAVVTMGKGVQWEGMSGSGHRVIMDGPEEAGGKNAGFRPMELMLLGLGFCMGYDMVMILRRMRKEVTGYQINLTGQRAEDPPSIYTAVTLEHIITGKGLSEAAVERALDLAENKYCSASAMFGKTATLTNKFRIEEAQ